MGSADPVSELVNELRIENDRLRQENGMLRSQLGLVEELAAGRGRLLDETMEWMRTFSGRLSAKA